MSEHALDRLDVGAGLHREGCGGVAEVMESHGGKSRVAKSSLEPRARAGARARPAHVGTVGWIGGRVGPKLPAVVLRTVLVLIALIAAVVFIVT